MERMPTRDYERFRTAIEVANDQQDKDALRKIQKQLIAEYGLNNSDVEYLLKKFRYNV